MIPTKAMTPHVPISPAEVIDDACGALERGVAIVHLHARDDEAAHISGRDLRDDDPRASGVTSPTRSSA